MPTTVLKNPVNVNISSSDVCLQVSGTQAAATATSGAFTPNVLTVMGPAGQDTTGTTGQTAGVGAAVEIIAGTGGSAPSGSANGKGGSVIINPGAPGAGGGTVSAYGNVLMATNGGRVAIGTTTPAGALDVWTTGPVTFNSTRIGNNLGAVAFNARKANTGMTAVANGHEIGSFTYSGFDGSVFIAGARIRTVVDGPVSAGNVPVAITFMTGAGTLSDESNLGDDNAVVERLRMTSAGNIGIGTPAPTSKLHVNGGVQVGVPTGGDMGTGSINVSGDIYKNGTPMLEMLEEAHRLVLELKKRTDTLEAELARLAEKGKI